MARRVKCQDTGEYSTSDVAYRAENGKYYSSETNYLQWREQKEWREKSIDLLFNIFGFSKDMIVPSMLFKNLQKYESMGYDVVYDTIVDQQKNIQWALQNKTFRDTTGMIIYVCKILENHMIDVYKKKKKEQKRQQLQEQMIIPDDIEVNNKKQTSKDISRFLED